MLECAQMIIQPCVFLKRCVKNMPMSQYCLSWFYRYCRQSATVPLTISTCVCYFVKERSLCLGPSVLCLTPQSEHHFASANGTMWDRELACVLLSAASSAFTVSPSECHIRQTLGWQRSQRVRLVKTVSRQAHTNLVSLCTATPTHGHTHTTPCVHTVRGTTDFRPPN